MIREVNSTENDSLYLKLYRETDTGLHAITAPRYKQLANKISLSLTFFAIKINRNTLPLSERMTITANSFTKIDQPDGFLPLW